MTQSPTFVYRANVKTDIYAVCSLCGAIVFVHPDSMSTTKFIDRHVQWHATTSEQTLTKPSVQQ